jgi:hypothetical protein
MMVVPPARTIMRCGLEVAAMAAIRATLASEPRHKGTSRLVYGKKTVIEPQQATVLVDCSRKTSGCTEKVFAAVLGYVAKQATILVVLCLNCLHNGRLFRNIIVTIVESWRFPGKTWYQNLGFSLAYRFAQLLRKTPC